MLSECEVYYVGGQRGHSVHPRNIPQGGLLIFYVLFFYTSFVKTWSPEDLLICIDITISLPTSQADLWML